MGARTCLSLSIVPSFFCRSPSYWQFTPNRLWPFPNRFPKPFFEFKFFWCFFSWSEYALRYPVISLMYVRVPKLQIIFICLLYIGLLHNFRPLTSSQSHTYRWWAHISDIRCPGDPHLLGAHVINCRALINSLSIRGSAGWEVIWETCWVEEWHLIWTNHVSAFSFLLIHDR